MMNYVRWWNMNNRAVGLLGLAMRARKLSFGEGVISDIQNGHAKLVLISDSASENTKKKHIDKCTYYKVPYVIVDEMGMNQAVGKANRMSLSVNDEGFAKNLLACLKG